VLEWAAEAAPQTRNKWTRRLNIVTIQL
jgi:hypothetical protein